MKRWETCAKRGGTLLTFSTGVCLHKLIYRAGFREFGGETGQLREHFVDQPDFRGKIVTMYMQGKKPTDVA